MGLPHMGHNGFSSVIISRNVFDFLEVLFALLAEDKAENTFSVREDKTSQRTFQTPSFLFIVRSSAILGPVSSVNSFGPLHCFEQSPHSNMTLSVTDISIS